VAITACLPDGCCPAGCTAGNDPDCAGCGDGEIEAGEECDDANASNTDGCLNTCVAASCGDGFLYAGVEQCDDGNNVNFDGCSASCSGSGSTFGPVHSFAGLSSSFYVTQFNCSNTGGDPAGDALWFCQHFYNAACTVQPVWMATQSSVDPKMHSGTNCNNPDPGGVSVPNTNCIGGPCKIGSYPGSLGGLANLICDCP
jgi:cysteine-rich repeat protein